MSVELYRESPGKFDSRTLKVGKLLVGGLGVCLTIIDLGLPYAHIEIGLLWVIGSPRCIWDLGVWFICLCCSCVLSIIVYSFVVCRFVKLIHGLYACTFMHEYARIDHAWQDRVCERRRKYPSLVTFTCISNVAGLQTCSSAAGLRDPNPCESWSSERCI